MSKPELASKRLGKIKFSKDQLLELDACTIELIFSKFQPLSKEESILSHTIEYLGLSECFAELEQGEPIPNYTPLLHVSEDGELSFNFKREEDNSCLSLIF